MSTPNERVAQRWMIINKGTAIVSVAAFWLASLLWMYWGVAGTTDIDPDIGRTWPLNYRGRVVYLLDGEFALLMGLFALFFLGMIVFILIEALVGPYQRRRER